MISSMGKSDPDVMTVSPGTDDKLLLTFAAGITTDVGAVNANGLRADFKDSSKVEPGGAAGAHRSFDRLDLGHGDRRRRRSTATAAAT